MRTIMILILCLILFLSACGQVEKTKIVDKYQLISGKDGNVYRLDKSSGEVWIIRESTMERVESKPLRIRTGQRYTGDDDYSFTYVGKGQVGDVKTLGEELGRYWK